MIETSTTEIFIGIMVLIRAGALLMFIPPLGGEAVPKRVRILLAALLALMVLPVVARPDEVPAHTLGLVIVGGKEVVVGLFMGLAVRMVLYAVDYAGRVMAHESSLMMSMSFDPLSNSQTSTISSLLFYFTVIFMMILGVHHAVLLAFVRSYDIIGIGMQMPGPQGMQEMIHASTEVFSLGVRMAGPLIALNFVINLSMAILGKVAPKINVFMTSFAVRIMASLWLLAGSSMLVAQYIYNASMDAPDMMLRFLLP